jgi:hypothetical protein
MDVCNYSAFVLSCVGSGLATGLISRPRSPTDCVYDEQTIKQKSSFIIDRSGLKLLLFIFSMNLQVLLLGLGQIFSFLILYTIGRTPWTGDQPVARPLPTHMATNRINAHRHPCVEWDSNSRSQRSSDHDVSLNRIV